MSIVDLLFVIIEKDGKYQASFDSKFLKDSFDTIDEAKKALFDQYILNK